MDFSRFTDQQEDCVRHLDGPLFIAAGAGSGKTFTLQNRITWALMEESESGIRSIEEVLAITFTEKATAEIKARVRSALREAGMVEEALKVDSAWISTIHGMCSRILKEHALEAGVDPNFTVLSEPDAAALLDQAIEEVLSAEKNSREYAALFAEYGVRGGGFGEIALFEMLDTILSKSASFTRRIDALDFGPDPASARVIAKRLKDGYKAAAEHGATLLNPKKKQARLAEALGICEEAIKQIDALGEDDFDFEKLVAVFKELKPVRMNAFGEHDPEGYAFFIKQELDWAAKSINATLARPHAASLVSLARKVDAAYQAKLDEHAALDNNGLLHRTLSMLTAHPEITEGYTKRFKLVMVDEFQDTNQLQVDLIERVAGNARLCTVGDAQQSIYRFNGADVSVFEARRKAVEHSRESGVNAIERNLDENFRSHADILAFVRAVCGHDRVFGDAFLDLRASRKGAENRYKGSDPRVNLNIVTYEGSVEDSGAREAEASFIAERFSQLRKEGHHAEEMVVLLSKTTNADVYAKALRAQGFECVLEGGKSFFEKDEVRVVVNLLAALANPADSKKLFAVLTSPMIHLSADDLLALGTYAAEDGRFKSRSIERGLKAPDVEGASAALQHAMSMLNRASKRIKREAPSRVVMEVLLDSGWLSRLEREGAVGSSQAANILKAIGLVEEIERKPGYRLARVAREFAALATSSGEGPASLAVSGQNAVRIMTIHKSKGLEFPIVAVANFEPSKKSSKHFALTTKEGTIHLALGMKNNAVSCKGEVSGSHQAQNPSLAGNDAALHAFAITEHNWTEELAEAQRKFYVACTRASEYLLVSSIVAEKKPEDDPVAQLEKAYAQLPVLDDVRAALCGEMVDFPEENGFIDYRGSAPARFTHLYVSKEKPFLAGDERHEEPRDIEIPILETASAPPAACSSIRNGVFSYSSIAPEEDHLPVLERDDLSAAATPRPDRLASEEGQGETVAFEPSPHALGDREGKTPSATDVGSAFHRVGQLAIERLSLTSGKLEIPPVAAVDAIARSLNIEGTSRERLQKALDRWFASSIARTAESYGRIRAEVPFMVGIAFDQGREQFLEGEIDLLAESGDETRALVIDYKTGGSPTETDERLQAKHQLQARCYAYALLSSRAYERIDFAFVRVEQNDPSNPHEPQIVRYHYSAADIDALRDAIIAAWREKQLP